MESAHATHVVVGISGGVDSAVAAALLKDQGLQVTGLFMKNWEEDDDVAYCGAAEDLAVAETVCAQLGVRLHTVNFSHEYWERVFAVFLREYRAGRTPNPDVLCNKEIKFREFLDYAEHLGADAIATGHYARRETRGGLPTLYKGADQEKDQSYFLYSVSREALSKTLFPLGRLTKTEVRQRARDLGLHNSERKDSTGICFIGERRFKDFLSRYLPNESGRIETPEGALIGQHDGLWFYTLGQRQGLDIGGPGEAWYVSGKDVARNVLEVVQGHDHPALMCKTLRAVEPEWLTGDLPTTPLTCNAKTRYRQDDQSCVVTQATHDTIDIEFQVPQRAATPGQALVLYHEDRVLGGGTIDQIDYPIDE